MQNISRSGLLFTARRAHSVDTRMELTFALPKVIHDEPPATVRCQGRVVRSVVMVAEKAQPAIAIQILDYQFMRTATPPPLGGT